MNKKRSNFLISKLSYNESFKNLSEQWLKKANEFNRKIFIENSKIEDFNKEIRLIKDKNCVFDKLISTDNKKHRIASCQAIFNYCEMSQDWRVLGIWLKQEIDQLEIQEVRKDCNQNVAWLYFAYGRYLEETGKFSQSSEFHKKGIEISKKHNDFLHLALNKLGIGIALQRFTKTHDIQKAVEYLVQATDFFRVNNFLYQESNSLMNLGSCYDRLGKDNNAIESYEKSIDILKKLNNQFDLGRAYYSLGIVHVRNTQF